MREHFRYVGDFGYAVLHKRDFYVGGCVGLAFVGLALITGRGAVTAALGILAIETITFAFVAYGVYREERAMRAKHEAEVTVTVRVGSQAINYPDPGRGKWSISLHVLWEIWVQRDISTDRLGLNIIYRFKRKPWQLWKKREVPFKGIPPKGKTTEYRRTIYMGGMQPFKDSADFEFVSDIPHDAADFRCELVLHTGVPRARYSALAAVDWNEIRARGTNPPL
jgi:hypothetical protein